MFDVSDDAKGGYRRVEILTGPGRRRRWSADEKARIASGDGAAAPYPPAEHRLAGAGGRLI